MAQLSSGRPDKCHDEPEGHRPHHLAAGDQGVHAREDDSVPGDGRWGTEAISAWWRQERVPLAQGDHRMADVQGGEVMRQRYGTGSVTQRKDGRFEVRRIVVDRNGNRKRKGLGTVSTMAEAKRLLRQAPDTYYLPAKRKRDDDAKDTVASFIARWLEKAVKPGRTSTYTLYQQHMRLYVLPVIGEKLLHRITRADIEQVQRHAHGAGVGAATIGLTLKILTTALNYAINKEELPDVRNVVKGADRLHRIKPRDYAFLTAKEGQHLLTQAAEWRYVNAIAVMLYCGLGVKGFLAVAWQDVDLERGTLHVAHSLKHVGGGKRELGETKTEKSNRTIAMPQVVITALKAQRKAQMAAQAEADVWLNTDKLGFTAAFGETAADSP